jgi:hypothetical protein
MVNCVVMVLRRAATVFIYVHTHSSRLTLGTHTHIHTHISPMHCNGQFTVELTKSFARVRVCMCACACVCVCVCGWGMCCRYLALSSCVARAGFHDKGNGGRCDRPGRGCVLRPWVFLRDSGTADAHRKDESAGHLNTHKRDQLLFEAHKNEGQLDAGIWEPSGTAAHPSLIESCLAYTHLMLNARLKLLR